MNIEDIARAAHEINRAYCLALGDNSQLPWNEAPEWQQASAMDGVKFHIDNPHAGPEASHNNWLRDKVRDGWVYGATKNPEKKEHPCMVAFTELPVTQQAKDYLFREVVHVLSALDPGAHLLALDYNEAKQVFSDQLARNPTGYGRMDAALLKAFEHVFRRGIHIGRAYERDLQQCQQILGGNHV